MRILAITGTRAEYGLLYPVLEKLERNPFFDLRLLATCMHLEERFGMTVGEIEADGFPVHARVPLNLRGDSGLDIALAMGEAVKGIGQALEEQRPDLVLLLGDRFEILAAATAASALRVPVAHMEGGHVTEGAMDDAFRHAVTKLSHLHFTACEPYRQRIIQMGEPPQRVHAVGSTGIDNILNLKRLPAEELSRQLNGFDLSNFLLVTFHPCTLEFELSEHEQVSRLLRALDAFPDFNVLITAPNADAGNDAIFKALQAYARDNGHRCRLVTSLGRVRYISAMALARAVVGNSSSGIIEAPSMGVPTVNIGIRQKGRIRAESVIDVPTEHEAIVCGLQEALSPRMQQLARTVRNPYGDGHASERIVQILQRTDPATLQPKPFHDLCMPGAT